MNELLKIYSGHLGLKVKCSIHSVRLPPGGQIIAQWMKNRGPTLTSNIQEHGRHGEGTFSSADRASVYRSMILGSVINMSTNLWQPASAYIHKPSKDD